MNAAVVGQKSPTKPVPQYWYRAYRYCFLFLFLISTFLDLPPYLFIKSGLAPKYIYIGFLVMSAPLIASCKADVTKFLTAGFGFIYTTLLAITCVHLGVAAAVLEDRRVNLIVTLAFSLVAILPVAFVVSRAKISDIRIPVLISCISVPAIIVTDFFSPGLYYPLGMEGTVLARGAGTFLNPNRAAEAAILLCLLSFPLLNLRSRTCLFLFVSIGVLFTFSRAGIIACVLLGGFSIWTRALPRWIIMIPVAGAMGLVAISPILEDYIRAETGLSGGIDGILERLDFFQSASTGDDSSSERKSVAISGIELFTGHPVFGAGAMATGTWNYSAGTHNQLIELAAEYGLAGLVIWAVLVGSIWRGYYMRTLGLQGAAAGLFVFFSMFSHNQLDAPYWIIAICILCLVKDPLIAKCERAS